MIAMIISGSPVARALTEVSSPFSFTSMLLASASSGPRSSVDASRR